MCACVSLCTFSAYSFFKKVWDLVANFRNLEEYSRFFHDNDDEAPVDDQSTLHVHMFSSDFSRNLRKAGSRFQIYCTDPVCFYY